MTSFKCIYTLRCIDILYRRRIFKRFPLAVNWFPLDRYGGFQSPDRRCKLIRNTHYSPIINIKSELPEDMDRLLRSLTLWVGDSQNVSYQGKISELSLGGANLIYITLKLVEFSMKKPMQKLAHFLLIEEPEAHIHTHVQKTLFGNLDYEDTQVIITTHSTHISAVSKISSVNVLSLKGQDTAVYQPSKNLSVNQIVRIERYLDAVRSTLLFAKGVILVEGDAEQILLPEMFKTVFGISLDEVGVSVINMSSSVFDNISIIFSDDRIQRRCSIITDLDKSILPLSDNEADDSQDQKDCRNSEISGLRRYLDMEDLYKTNQWIKPFYAPHTFEVDFLLAGNTYEVVQCLEEIYVRGIDKNTSKSKLESTDISVAGWEVLRLAKKMGKGWFAILIGEKINTNTVFPDYILKAISFAAKDQLTDNIFLKILKYRNREFWDYVNKDDIPNILVQYIENYTEDDLTKLIIYSREK